jgi:hypothetical protein
MSVPLPSPAVSLGLGLNLDCEFGVCVPALNGDDFQIGLTQAAASAETHVDMNNYFLLRDFFKHNRKRIYGVASCLGGAEPDLMRVRLQRQAPADPRASTSAKDMTVYLPGRGRKNGGYAPYNSGGNSQVPDRAAGGINYFASMAECITVVITTWPSG